jgi:hypothetical protein
MGSCYVAQADLDLKILSLPRAGIIDLYHHPWLSGKCLHPIASDHQNRRNPTVCWEQQALKNTPLQLCTGQTQSRVKGM